MSDENPPDEIWVTDWDQVPEPKGPAPKWCMTTFYRPEFDSEPYTYRYIRADLHEARIAELEADRDGFKQQSIDWFKKWQDKFAENAAKDKRIAELEADKAHFEEAWRLASLRADRHYKRIAELEATNRNHVKAGQLHEQRIAELERPIARFNAEVPDEIWTKEEIVEAVEYLKHGAPWEYGGAALGLIASLESLLARAMPMLKWSRDGHALYRELEGMGIEPVEADAVQCREGR